MVTRHGKYATERYPLRSSPLFKLRTQRKLAELLRVSVRDLKWLAAAVERDPSRCFNIEQRQVGKKIRTIEVPVGRMRRVHETAKSILNRIELPDYLMSPRRRRSVVSNALVHRDAIELVKIDIKNYYPSTTRELVFRLFRYKFEMPDDVAGLVTKILTVNGHVPVGSPASPIVAFWASREVFDSIDGLAEREGLSFSLWVDDLTISGPHVAPQFVSEALRQLATLHYVGHKVRFQSRRRGFNVTGVRIDSRGLGPTNATNLKIRDELERLKRCEPQSDEYASSLGRLIGLNSHRLSTLSDYHPTVGRAKALQQYLRQRTKRRISDVGP